MRNEHEFGNVLRGYSAFLASSQAPGAQHWADKLGAALLESDVVAGAQKVLSFYGGMGSINDIVFPFGSPERKKYHDLGERLYQLAEECSRGS